VDLAITDIIKGHVKHVDDADDDDEQSQYTLHWAYYATPCQVANLCLLSVSVMPNEDTLKWTPVAVGGVVVDSVALMAFDSASGPVRLSVSTLLMYSTLQAAVQHHTQHKQSVCVSML